MVLSLFFSMVFVLLLLAALITVQHTDLATPSMDLARGLQDSANKTLFYKENNQPIKQY